MNPWNKKSLDLDQDLRRNKEQKLGRIYEREERENWN